MNQILGFDEFINEVNESGKWSAKVKERFHTKEGLFTRSAKDIAKGLKSKASSLKQAMSRLNFYTNRAGANLSKEDKARMEEAKEILASLYK